MLRSQVIDASRHVLRDSSGVIWSDAVLNTTIDQVLREVALKEGILKRVCLPFVEYTTDIDLSTLTDLVRPLSIEYPTYNGSNPPVKRTGHRMGDTLSLDLSTVPAIVGGTLTGTITFTKGSRAVTGVASLFTSELSDNYFIALSSASRYYHIAKVKSATELILLDPYEGETKTDTVSVTKYRSNTGCVRLWYVGEYILTQSIVTHGGSGLDDITVSGDFTGSGEVAYKVAIDGTSTTNTFKWSDDGGLTWDATTVSMTGSAQTLNNGMTLTFAATTGHTLYDYWTFTVSPTNLPKRVEDIVILGVVAHASQEYAAGYLQSRLTGVVTSLAASASSVSSSSARITQALNDLISTRAELATELDNFIDTLADTETTLDQIGTDLTAGRAVINTVNIGGDVASKYADYGKTQVEEAGQRIAKARAYLEAAKTAHDYVDYATTELSAASGYLAQAEATLKIAEQSINSAGLVKAYQSWSNYQNTSYTKALNTLGRVEDGVHFMGAR